VFMQLSVTGAASEVIEVDCQMSSLTVSGWVDLKLTEPKSKSPEHCKTVRLFSV